MKAFTGSVVAPLMVSGLVVLAFAAPATSLEYHRQRVAAGEGWRLLTGQLVHWSAPMMATDLGVLLVSAAVIERYSRRLLIGSLVVSAAAVAAGVHFLETDLTRYRGSSGLAAAVVVTASLELSQRPGTSRKLAAAVLGTLAVKLIYELATGAAMLPGTTPPGILIAPWVHLAGAASGAAVWVANRLPQVARACPERA